MTNYPNHIDSLVTKTDLKVLVLTGPGTNCDAETLFAFNYLGAAADEESLRLLSEHPGKLADYHILVLPGGFTYGDYVGAGTLYAAQLLHSLKDEVLAFLNAGKFILGICNGFQVLTKAGLLPGLNGSIEEPSVTLEANQSLKFEDRWVHLKTSGKSFWTEGLPDVITLPVAHAEGRLVTRDKKVQRNLESAGHTILHYCAEDGSVPKYPENPNGSEHHIAAMINSTGQIMGLMPHPERFILPQQHPAQSRGEFTQTPHGYMLLNNLVKEARSRFTEA